MRTIFAGISLAFTGFALASPPQYKVEKLFQLSSPSVAAKYRTVSEFTNNGRIIYDDDAPNLQTGKFEYVAGGSTNISKIILGNSSDPRAIYRSESGKYAVAPDWDHGGFLRDGLTGENYGPRPFPNHESVNVMGITERYTFGSSFFHQPSHTYGEVAYIYDHMTRTRYDLNPNNYETDARRTTAMNEAGQAVVEYFPGPEPYQPINVEQCELWQNGVRRVIGQMSDAKINSSGQVIGRIVHINNPNRGMMQFWDGTSSQMFSYSGGNPTSLSDDNLAFAIYKGSDGAYYPSKLLDVNTRTGYDLHDLTPNMSAGMITYHGLIRADGAIAAIGVENGKSYLLKFTPVPEPASLVALGAGVLVLIRRRR